MHPSCDQIPGDLRPAIDRTLAAPRFDVLPGPCSSTEVEARKTDVEHPSAHRWANRGKTQVRVQSNGPMRAAFFLVALSFGAAPGRAQARIEELQVSLAGDQVLAGFRLAGAFSDELRERIQSGLPTSILYELELQRDRKRWYDRNLASSTLQVAAMYNAVSREYLVNFKLDGELVESRVVHESGDCERAMTEIAPLPAFSLAGMPSTRRLLVRVRAELGSRTWLLFIPTRVVTEWRDSSKFRPPPGPG